MATYHRPSELARQFRVTSRTIHNLVHRGELDAVWFGKQLRISDDALQAYLTRQRANASGGPTAP